MNDFGVLQECTECESVCMPQSYVKTVVCSSCPPGVLKRMADNDERSEKFFMIRQSELKCEECWLQIIFSKKVSQMTEEVRVAQSGWELPDEYSYFCITCNKVTDW